MGYKREACMLVFCPIKGTVPGISYFHLTKNRYDTWLEAIGLDPAHRIYSKCHCICSLHFDQNDINHTPGGKVILAQGAVPKFNLGPNVEHRKNVLSQRRAQSELSGNTDNPVMEISSTQLAFNWKEPERPHKKPTSAMPKARKKNRRAIAIRNLKLRQFKSPAGTDNDSSGSSFYNMPRKYTGSNRTPCGRRESVKQKLKLLRSIKTLRTEVIIKDEPLGQNVTSDVNVEVDEKDRYMEYTSTQKGTLAKSETEALNAFKKYWNIRDENLDAKKELEEGEGRCIKESSSNILLLDKLPTEVFIKREPFDEDTTTDVNVEVDEMDRYKEIISGQGGTAATINKGEEVLEECEIQRIKNEELDLQTEVLILEQI